MNDVIKERFLSHVKVGDGCWEWSSYISRFGYGIFRFGGYMQAAHRVSYQLFICSVLPGLCVCHSCDNRKCVRPSHLWIGTRGQNNSDRKIKGRNRNQWGEKNSRAVLNMDKVRLIRSDRLLGMSIPKLSLKYSVGTSTIHRVVTNSNWNEK